MCCSTSGECSIQFRLPQNETKQTLFQKALWKSLLEAAQNRVFAFSLGVFFLYSKRHVRTTLFVLGYASVFFVCILSKQFYRFFFNFCTINLQL